jgi:DNA-binding MarR family transcriptional regulator/GNAT superfamily N-acetyltransferase
MLDYGKYLSRRSFMNGPTAEQIAAVRQFNRTWTQMIGVLTDSLLQTSYSLSEARVLYELAQRDGALASDLTRTLGLDAGYLSRMLSRFSKDGLLDRQTSADDARRQHLRLTDRGRAEFDTLNARQEGAVGAMLATIGADDRRRMLAAMATVERCARPHADAPDAPPFILRPHHAGDLGWVVWRHGALYASEFGWDARFEGMVARIIADFVDNFDPAWENSWIAERDGENIGCVFVVRDSDQVAKLRMLLVEPSARGLGLGRTLVAECVRFAREKGYRSMILLTNDILHSARRIYLAEGFTLVHEEEREEFGRTGVWQKWELVLQSA